MPAEIRIGTSGYSYKHWRGRYYPEDLPSSEWLRFYLRDFDTVELNNTFYHLPTEQAFDNWRKATPHGFLFAVKGSRSLTHMIKLKDPERGLVNFMPRAERLRWKLGPILWQLPPKWNANVERLETFLSLLPKHHRYAFELRDQTWMSDEISAVLRKFNRRIPLASRDHVGLDVRPPAWTDTVQVPGQLHGPGARRMGEADSRVVEDDEGDLRLLRQRRFSVRGRERAHAEASRGAPRVHARRTAAGDGRRSTRKDYRRFEPPKIRSRNRKRLMKSR